MPSGRELTSRLSSEHPGESSTFYVPHVFDFVSIFKPADYYGGLSEVPPLYLEPLAVEQSIVVGQGASISAYKKAIPQAPAEPVTIKMDGMIITHSPQKAWPRHVIYKVARVAFTQIGTPTPQTRQAMKAALMEVYSLVHGPLREHPNIIKLLALAWGPNYFNPSHRLPVLVVEFADYGNLARLQEKKDLDSLTKCRLAVDIGEGLSMLHRCGIIHGDVKSENVLIFSDPEKEFIAKLSDFGFSTVAEAADADELVGGTRPWKAPETNSPVQKHLLQATDTYSYGLLVWRLAIDGKDPFHLWVSSSRCGESYLEHLEQIKADDEPVRKASLDTWFISYISQKHADLTVDPLTQALSSLQLAEAAIESAQTEGTMSMTTWETIMNSLGPCLKVPELWQVVSGPVLQYAQQNSFYGRLPSTLSHCISADPTKRNLRKAITTLTGGKSPDARCISPIRAILVHNCLILF
jgi:serine/threonine protein kinase